MHLHPRGPGRSADVLSLLGALLHGAQHRQGRRESGAWPGQRQQLRGVLQRDGERQVRTPSRPRRPGAHGHRSVQPLAQVLTNQLIATRRQRVAEPVVHAVGYTSACTARGWRAAGANMFLGGH